MDQLACRFHDKIGEVPEKDLYLKRLNYAVAYVYEKCVVMLLKRVRELREKEVGSIVGEELPKTLQEQNKLVTKWVKKNQQTQEAAINRLV